ncbi:MAG: GntR family transcriptional regulator [Anaerolineae bacterium]|nr:GntR family transcriptional regulator [Anaerolineae bacterium]
MVNRSHPLPLYYQLMQELRHRIEGGQWAPGDRIPSERELSETYGISRMTVRQALAELVDTGLLRRDQGRGTFVAEPRMRRQITRLMSFTEDMRARGRRASARVLRLELVPARPSVADALEIEVGEQVVLIERLRLADGEPVALESSHLHFPGCEGVVHEDLSGSLYRLLHERFGLTPSRAREELEAGACEAHQAQLLGIRRGEPVLALRRRTLDQDGRPIEYVESVYRADRYIVSLDLVTEET